MGSSGKKEARAIERGAEAQLQAQREALDYLRETEAVPGEIREDALRELSGLFLGDENPFQIDQAQLIEQAKGSPLYEAITGTLDTSQEALRRQGIAGGLSGSTDLEAALVRDRQQVQQQALLQSYNQALGQERYEQQAGIAGIQNLAGLPSLAPQIAAGITGLGQTEAQGIIGARQAKTQAEQARIGNILGAIGVGAQGGAALGTAFSDRRLKDSIQFTGETVNGFRWYSWIWNRTAEDLGLRGSCAGVMADEVEVVRPDLVTEVGGYKAVNYGGVFHGV